MPLVEDFYTIQGEGFHSGKPAYFIRLGGCDVGCRWCDAKYTWNPKVFPPVDVETVVARAAACAAQAIVITGGEPLLYPDFLVEFRLLCGSAWHLCAETSLSVPREAVEKAAECIDTFYIDCKDTDPDIYRKYTGRSNALMLANLEWLLKRIGPDRIIVRIPMIPEFNSEADQLRSKALLTDMGIRNFDLFSYRIPQNPPQ